MFLSMRSQLRTIFKTLLLISTFLFPLGCNLQQDRIDAEKIASRIHSQLQRNDFLSVYEESSQSFKEVGDGPTFVARMHQFSKENGSLTKANSISYRADFDSVVGKKLVLTFSLEFERGRAREHLTFTRSKDGQLQLWDLVLEPVP